jgi:hypothetical protein
MKGIKSLDGFDFDWASVRTLIQQHLENHYNMSDKKIAKLEQLVNFHELQISKHTKVFDEVQYTLYQKKIEDYEVKDLSQSKGSNVYSNQKASRNNHSLPNTGNKFNIQVSQVKGEDSESTSN